MLKNLSRLECIIAGKAYHLLCDQDSPLEHAKEALCQFLKYIGNVEDAAKAQQEAIKIEPAVSEVKPEEPKPI